MGCPPRYQLQVLGIAWNIPSDPGWELSGHSASWLGPPDSATGSRMEPSGLLMVPGG